VARLVRHLVERNTHDILSRTSLTYDEAAGSFRTPLGIVDQDAVDEARAVLAAIADVVAGRAASTGWEALVERYMMLIPRDIGRHRPTLASLFPDLGAVHAQTGVLDSLEASIRAVKASMRASRAPAAAASTAIGSNGGGGGDGVAAGGSAQSPRIFNAALRPVADAALCDSVGALFREGLNVAHSSQSLRLHRVFDVRIDAMAAAFADTAPRVGNVRRLWHGTRASNVLSILQGGMVVPPSTSSFVTGRLYGDGLYFSDQSTKALNYAIGRAPGQRVGAADDARATGSFMFLCDVALGRAYTPQGRGGDRYPVAGYDSTYARGGVSGVLNNEMIVYATAQANPLYLCEFRDADHLR
jgi:poly [ADP-ribose] polymerase